jgi:Ca2+-binding RTX toxin-like protein
MQGLEQGEVMALNLSSSSQINALLSGWSWTGRVGSSTSIDYTIRANSELSVADDLRLATTAALREFANVANISFDYQIVSSLNNTLQQSRTINGQDNLNSVPLIFSAPQTIGSGILGLTSFPFAVDGPPEDSRITAADVDVAREGTTLSAGDEGFVTLLHEIGHALGFAHPDQGESQDGTTLSDAEQTTDATVMNAFFPDFNPGDVTENIRPSSLMIYDIAAIQYLYGVNRSYNAGDNTYEYDGTATQARTLWDAGGTDMLSTIGYTGNVIVDLREGFQNVTEVGNRDAGTGTFIWLAFGSNIENASSGQGGDIIFGNSLANRITSGKNRDSVDGGAGNDDINGNLGADTVLGGEGDDFVRGGKGADNVQGGNGNDTVNGNFDDDILAGNSGNDSVNGNESNDIITGDAGNDTLKGGQGVDQLFGGTGADIVGGDLGNDRLNGGTGADIFVFGANCGTDIIEDFNLGEDRIQVSSVLSASIDDIINTKTTVLESGLFIDFGSGNSITILGAADIAPTNFIIA